MGEKPQNVKTLKNSAFWTAVSLWVTFRPLVAKQRRSLLSDDPPPGLEHYERGRFAGILHSVNWES